MNTLIYLLVFMPMAAAVLSYLVGRRSKSGRDLLVRIVVAAEFELTPKPEEEVWAKMKELIGKRRASQPLDLPSAGSAFKRPVGGYAAALIDQTGLKGFQVGGAAVSEKHAGFVVNVGGATAADVQELLKQVSDKVFDRTGIRLEPEVRIW
jgi:UDP-N-acetylmuramate dehydrogenase